MKEHRSAAPVFHLGAGREDVGEYALIAGDPGRVPLIAARFEDARLVTEKRGFVVWAGLVAKTRVCAVCGGVGAPSTAIVVEELMALGARTLIRVGTCGSLQERVRPGDLVIATAAVRDEGTTKAYAPVEYPAVADRNVTEALLLAAGKSGAPHHCGVVHCKDAFFSELPDLTALPAAGRARWEAWRNAGVLATEMETAALFIIAGMRGRRSGAILLTVGSTAHGCLMGPIPDERREALVSVAVDALRRLIELDSSRPTMGS